MWLKYSLKTTVATEIWEKTSNLNKIKTLMVILWFKWRILTFINFSAVFSSSATRCPSCSRGWDLCVIMPVTKPQHTGTKVWALVGLAEAVHALSPLAVYTLCRNKRQPSWNTTSCHARLWVVACPPFIIAATLPLHVTVRSPLFDTKLNIDTHICEELHLVWLLIHCDKLGK